LRLFTRDEMRKGDGTLRLLLSKRVGACLCQAGMAMVEPGQSIPGNVDYSVHDAEEASFVISGEITITTPDGSATVRAGELVFVPAGEPHATSNNGRERAEVLWFLAPPVVAEG